MRISFNANSERLGDQEDQFAEQMIRLAPPWLTLVRWNFALAERIHVGTGGKTKIIMRLPGGDEKTEWKPTEAQRRQGLTFNRDLANNTISEWAKLNRPYLYFNVLNEPTWNGPDELRAMLSYLEYFMDTAALNGVHCVVLNGGADNKESIEAGLWDNFLRALDKYAGFHYLGVHEYAPPSMPSGHNHPADWLLDVERVQPNWNPATQKGGWPRPDQMSTDLVGGRYPDIATICRGNWFDIRARQLGIRIPRRVVTEFGWASLSNIGWVYEKLRERYGAPPEFADIGLDGILPLENVLHGYWPQWSFEEAIIQQLQWADQVYPENVEGLCLYYCSNEPEWRAFNFLRTGIAERLIALKPAPEPPPLPPPPPEPEPPIPPAPKPAFNIVPWIVGALVVILALGVGAWLYSNFYFLRGMEVAMPSVLTPNEAAQMLLGMLYSIFAAGGTAVGATPLTNLLKTALALSIFNRTFHIGSFDLTLAFGQIPANHVAFGVASGFTVAAWVAYLTNTQPALNGLSDYIVQFAPFMTQLLAMLGFQKALYAASWRTGLPLFGTKRS